MPRRFGIFILLLASGSSQSAGFGIFDARTLSMGGTGVAAHKSDHALFYNPALLAFNDEFEEKNLAGRIHFPLLVAQVSQSLLDVEQFNSDDVSGQLSQSIASFNADGTPENAATVVTASRDVQSTLLELAGDDLLVDSYVGFAVSEPSRLEGGGVFIGLRVIGGGLTNVSDTDLALIDNYVEGLNFVASGGTQGSAQPQLFDANGALIDPNVAFDSSASGRGAAIAEVGIAMSKMTTIWGKSVALGLTPKLMSVETFDDAQRLVDDRLGSGDNNLSHMSFNMDLGAAINVSEKIRVGVAVKDAIRRKWMTGAGSEVVLAPRARLGASANFVGLSFAIDVDLNRNDPIADELPVRETTVGLEWDFKNWLKFRGGYRHDLEGNRDGIASMGIGWRIKRWYIDLGYAKGGDLQAGALQISHAI